VLKKLKMNEIMDIRLQHHLAQEFYRQQMLQRIPGNQSSRKKFYLTHHLPLGMFVLKIVFSFGDRRESKTAIFLSLSTLD
jgi:hypothetical protein